MPVSMIQQGRTLRVAPFTGPSQGPRLAAFRVSAPRRRVHTTTQRLLQAAGGSTLSTTAPPAISLTDNALTHLKRMRESKGSSMFLRMGVKTGGCSGMSYTMNFEDEGNVGPSDTVMEYEEGFRLVCDSKALLYLFGMSLDYSDELIGGGFKFSNPNAEKSCGCGKSFKAASS